MDALTICAVNYLPFAEVLGESYLKYNTEDSFSILVVDAHRKKFSKKEKFKYLTPSELDIPKNVFENMAFYYNVTELSTALKPSAIKTLINSGCDSVVYLDPDIQVFGELSEIKEALAEHSIVLTPHTVDPIPRDDFRPSEFDIMSSGTFNLGFIGIKKSEISSEMLNWWEERLQFDSISDPNRMLFTDQRWIDLVPSYFSYYSISNPSYNVAYWNLHERNISKKNGNYYVNSIPLKFFHFSGYKPEHPWLLSKYVADNPRVVISSSNALRDLFDEYRDLLIKNGLQNENLNSYGYENFESGKLIPSSLRRLYREDCIRAYKKNEILEPPQNWQEWATSRSIESGNLSRILFSLWKSRPDLMRRYPDATGTEAKELQIWAKNHGVLEKVIDEDFIQIGDLEKDSYPETFTRQKGINIAGYLNGEFGLGQSARLIYESAKATQLPIHSLISNRTKSRQQENFNNSSSDKIYPIIITVINADHLNFWIDDVGKQKIKNSTLIGVWAWETVDFPKHMHTAFELVDEIWAVSTFVRDAISKHTTKPVYVFPTPILRPENIELLNRAEVSLNKEDEYNLFIFDYMSVFNRKNPIGLINAHKQAFPNMNGPKLVIKSTNGEKDATNREMLRYMCQGRSDIILIEHYLSREQLTALVNECSVYVSLHRSEGYGLTLAEAMALGKPVIATNYSGNLDFMSEENSFLVPYILKPIGNGSIPYLPESEWAEPDLNYASELMKKLHLDKDLAFRIGRSAEQDVAKKFDLGRASSFISERVNYHYSIKARSIKKLKKLIKVVSGVKKVARQTIKFALKVSKIG